MSNMLSGSPILIGDNSIPGIKLHQEVEEVLGYILKKCTEFGLDYYPPIIEFMTYDEISEIASYGGFPQRYLHWQFGMEYEELSRGYEYGMHRISEMVINVNPCVIYCLDSNPLVDQVDVICHALGHSHFFKNNIYFAKTNTDMLNKMANHGTRINRYMDRWGEERVSEFIDHVLRLDTLIDPTNAWKEKVIKDPIIRDSRNYYYPNVRDNGHDYMLNWFNTDDFKKEEKEKVREQELVDELELLKEPERDIFAFLRDNAHLKPWQQDIMSMLYDEAIYFAPQRQTKTANEGFASYTDHHLMAVEGLSALGQKGEDCGIVEYAIHKMLVLGGRNSMNPYKIGFELLMDIEERWNKGRFGDEYEECRDFEKKKNWDTKLGKGKEKVFEVCKHCNDFTLIQEFFTPEFCEKHEFFNFKRYPNGEHKILNREFKSIRQKLLARHANGGLPDIRLADPNGLGKGWMMLVHYPDSLNRKLYDPYVREVMLSLFHIWKNCVVLESGEMVWICDGPSLEFNLTRVSKEKFSKEFVHK